MPAPSPRSLCGYSQIHRTIRRSVEDSRAAGSSVPGIFFGFADISVSASWNSSISLGSSNLPWVNSYELVQMYILRLRLLTKP